MPKFNFDFEKDNLADAATAMSALDSMSTEQQREFIKSEFGQALIKAVKPVGETFSKEHLQEHPAKHTEGQNKSKWNRAVEAATQGGKKKASYALSTHIHQKMSD